MISIEDTSFEGEKFDSEAMKKDDDSVLIKQKDCGVG